MSYSDVVTRKDVLMGLDAFLVALKAGQLLRVDETSGQLKVVPPTPENVAKLESALISEGLMPSKEHP